MVLSERRANRSRWYWFLPRLEDEEEPTDLLENEEEEQHASRMTAYEDAENGGDGETEDDDDEQEEEEDREEDRETNGGAQQPGENQDKPESAEALPSNRRPAISQRTSRSAYETRKRMLGLAAARDWRMRFRRLRGRLLLERQKRKESSSSQRRRNHKTRDLEDEHRRVCGELQREKHNAQRLNERLRKQNRALAVVKSRCAKVLAKHHKLKTASAREGRASAVLLTKYLKLQKVLSCERERKRRSSEEAVVECCICLNALPDVVFSPCRHAKTCSNCAASVKTCPICRAAITKRRRLFL